MLKWVKKLFRETPKKEPKSPRLIGCPLMDPNEEYIIMAAIAILSRDYERYALPWEILCRNFTLIRNDGNAAEYQLSIQKIE